jgi:DNA-binding NtrC family response regulator
MSFQPIHPAAGHFASHAHGALMPLPAEPEDRAGISILVIDDETSLRESCTTVLRAEGYATSSCGRGEEARELLRRKAFDIVLIDLYMTQVSGLELLDTCLGAFPETLVIIATGNPSVETSIAALRAGAWDYLPKPFAASHLHVLIGRAAHTVLVARESRALEAERKGRHSHSDRIDLLGSAPGFERAIALARRVASTDASVFISGESGTGKEQVAQFIHQHSRRSSRQLVAVNCAALPEALLESEMFGHVQGAFTGAVKDKPGLLEVANGGTLFLDEITEMPASVQAKLLRVIQDGMVRRVGSNATNAVVNVRFIAASNRDLQKAQETDVLRADLFYRLCVVPIHIPPLRERRDDIPLLAQHFLQRYWAQHRDGRAAIPTLTASGIESLQARSWPGNVRELQNVMEHAVVLLDPGAEIGPEDLPHMSEAAMASAAVGASVPVFDFASASYHAARDQILTDFERNYLGWLVEHARGNMSRAARIAGVDRTTLYRLMEKHGIQRDTVYKATGTR